MRQAVLIVTTIIVAMAIAWTVVLMRPSYYELRAGNIVQDAQGRVTGTFELKKTYAVIFRPGWPFIERKGLHSEGSGGACLYANPADINEPAIAAISCSTDAQCNIPGLAGSGSCDISNKKCWVRPGPGPAGTTQPPAVGALSAPFCNRSIDHNPSRLWSEGVHDANRRPLNLATDLNRLTSPPPRGARVQWRVIACLNLFDKAANQDSVTEGCSNQNGKLRAKAFGDLATVVH